jgi:tRNA modification GTPase
MFEDTICAPATPPLISAVAMVRVSGRDALRALECVRPRTEVLPRTARRASFYSGETMIDDILYTVFRAPASYTGEDTVEISCHGNPIIVRRIIDTLVSIGMRIAGPGEFTMRAYLNGRFDLTGAEAVQQIITARSSWELDSALKQMHGSLRRKIEEIRGQLVTLKADVESRIDFPDEDIPYTEDEGLVFLLEKVQSMVSDLLGRCRLGGKAGRGINVIIAGRPNAGKSSIMNLILNNERAIVSDIPGTTRDPVKEIIEIGGIPVNLIDTAGINETENEIEKIGVQLARRHIEGASVIVAVFDPMQGFGAADREVLEAVVDRPAVMLINKTDIAGAEAVSLIENEISRAGTAVMFSAKTGDGFQALHEALILAVRSELPGYEDSFIADSRVVSLLEGALASLAGTGILFREGIHPPEIAAFELQGALDFLAEITGEITPDDVLGSIFSRFCIGK